MDMNDLYQRFLESAGVVTDTRDNVAGAMFFCLKGGNFDGNAFAADAIRQGASFAVMDDAGMHDSLVSSCPDMAGRLCLVDDSLSALQDLAAMHRQKMGVPVLAITGTNGKTTTKELACAVLSKKYNVLATQGNLNNHIGVPLTLLKLDRRHQLAIIEMGASAEGEIRALCGIAAPTHGIITNVGKAHILGFGSEEAIRRTKGELYDYLKSTGGTVFYNAEDPALVSMLAERDMLGIAYGSGLLSARAIHPEDGSPYLGIRLGDGDEIRTNLVGDYNMNNVLAAVAIGRFFGVSMDDAVSAVGEYVPSNNRSQFYEGRSNKVIIDAYNANPTSMAASIGNFKKLKGDRKVLILGDMKELGPVSLDEHKKILLSIDAEDYMLCFFVGPEFISAASALGIDSDTKMLLFRDSDQLKAFLADNPLRNAYVLVKGSRSMRLEKVLDLIES